MKRGLVGRVERLELDAAGVLETSKVDGVQLALDFRDRALAAGWLESTGDGWRVTPEGRRQTGHDHSMLCFWSAWGKFGIGTVRTWAASRG